MIVRVAVHDINGRHVTCEDEAEYVGPWLLRSLKLVAAGYLNSHCAPLITVEYAEIKP